MKYNVEDWKKDDFRKLFRYLEKKFKVKIGFNGDMGDRTTRGNIGLCYYEGYILLRWQRGEKVPLRTMHILLHELAHWVLHGRMGKGNVVTYANWRKEVEAETVANYFSGIDSWKYRNVDAHYIEYYLNKRRSENPKTLEYIDKVVKRGIKKIEKPLNDYFEKELKMKEVKFEDLKDLDWVKAHVTFTDDSFDELYSEEERTYEIYKDSKYFKPHLLGSSLFGSSLAGDDVGIRLDKYMYIENGYGWKIEKVRIVE